MEDHGARPDEAKMLARLGMELMPVIPDSQKGKV
jgi:hypothetical protein